MQYNQENLEIIECFKLLEEHNYFPKHIIDQARNRQEIKKIKLLMTKKSDNDEDREILQTRLKECLKKEVYFQKINKSSFFKRIIRKICG